MSIADDFERFVPEAELPLRPLQVSLHAGYAAMALRRRAGLILLDDTDPAYLVTDDFIHIALMIEVGSLENTVGMRIAALLPVGGALRRWLSEDEGRGGRWPSLQESLGSGRSLVLPIAPYAVDARSESVPLEAPYQIYPVESPSKARSGWYFKTTTFSKEVLVPPVSYTCAASHKNASFDRGVCSQPNCGKAIRTRP